MTKFLAFAALLLLSSHGFSQRVGRVDFGPCFNAGCKLTSFPAAEMRVDATDSLFEVVGGRSDVYTVICRLADASTASLRMRSFLCVDRTGRRCLVTAVVDGVSAENSVVVAYPGYMTIYHLKIDVV